MMGYVEQSLSSGERVILKARLHWGMFINPLLGIAAVFLCILLSAVPFLVSYDSFRNIDIADYGITISAEELKISEADFNAAKPLFGIVVAG
jgi:hypothetical protein